MLTSLYAQKYVTKARTPIFTECMLEQGKSTTALKSYSNDYQKAKLRMSMT